MAKQSNIKRQLHPEHFDTVSVDDVNTAIDDGIHAAELTQRPIRTSVARLIALRIADSDDSALANFGRTGRLRRPDVLVELEWLYVPARHQAWAGALWDYLDQPVAYRRQVRRVA